MGCITDDDVLVFNIVFFIINVAALTSEIIKFLNCTPFTGMGGKRSTLLSLSSVYRPKQEQLNKQKAKRRFSDEKQSQRYCSKSPENSTTQSWPNYNAGYLTWWLPNQIYI